MEYIGALDSHIGASRVYCIAMAQKALIKPFSVNKNHFYVNKKYWKKIQIEFELLFWNMN